MPILSRPPKRRFKLNHKIIEGFIMGAIRYQKQTAKSQKSNLSLHILGASFCGKITEKTSKMLPILPVFQY